MLGDVTSPNLFLLGRLDAANSALDKFPGNGHKVYSCLLLFRPRLQAAATNILFVNESYKLANWAGLTVVLPGLNWSHMMLSFGFKKLRTSYKQA